MGHINLISPDCEEKRKRAKQILTLLILLKEGVSVSIFLPTIRKSASPFGKGGQGGLGRKEPVPQHKDEKTRDKKEDSQWHR